MDPYAFQNQKSTFDALYIEQFIRRNYYIGLIPFRPIRRGNVISLRKSIFQEIMCIIIYFLGLCWTLWKFSQSYPKGSLYASPSLIFLVISSGFQIGYIVSWAYTFEVRERDFRLLLNHGIGSLTGPIPFKKKVKCCFLGALHIFLSAFAAYCQISTSKNINRNCLSCCFPNINSPMTFVRNGKTVFASDCSASQMAEGIAKFVSLIFAEFIYNSVEVLVLILAITGYEMAKKAADESMLSRKTVWKPSEEDVQNLLKKMYDLQESFGAMNKAGNAFFLLALCLLVPWTSFRFTDILSMTMDQELYVEEILLKVFNSMSFLFYITLMYFGAETKRQIQIFRNNLSVLILRNDINYWRYAQMPHPSSGLELCKYVKVELREVCFHGGPFFQFSYSFMGTTFGVVITLILFELQFGKSTPSKFFKF